MTEGQTLMNPEPRSDEDLLRAARAGETRAFDALFERYERLLLRIAYSLLLDFDAAQDAAQEALIALSNNRATLNVDRPGAVRAYLITCTRNAAFDQWRAHQKPVPLDEELLESRAMAETALNDLLAEEQYAILTICLRRLPHKQRLVVVLRLLGDLLEDDIARLLAELGWAIQEAEAAAKSPTGQKIEEIAILTTPLGITTVGGVGNLLNKAKEALRECFDKQQG